MDELQILALVMLIPPAIVLVMAAEPFTASGKVPLTAESFLVLATAPHSLWRVV